MKALLYALLIADAISTANAVRHGATEDNPISRPFVHSAPVLMISVAFGQHEVDNATRGWSKGEQNTVMAFELFAEGYAIATSRGPH